MPVPKDPDLYDESGSASGLPTSSGPPPSSTAPGELEPLPGGPVEQSGSDDSDPEPLPEFDPRHREAFTGLLYLGKLEDQFSYLGHTFRIRTLRSGELLEISRVVQDFSDGLGTSRAYANATVAASVISVDGRELPFPITNDPQDTEFRNRFGYINDNWFPMVVDKVYEQVLELESKVAEVIAAMGKASG